MLLEKKSSQKVLMFKELTRELIKEHIAEEGVVWSVVWKNKKGKWILFKRGEYNLKNENIFINYDFWSVFEKQFNMNQQQIEYFITKRLWLDKKIKVNTIMLKNNCNISKIISL